MPRDPRIALEDMSTAIARIGEETEGLTFEQFADSWRAQYIVERALLILSEASRAIPEPLKEKHADIRWIGVRDIGNVLRHQYASLSPSLIWNVVHDGLLRLRAAISCGRTWKAIRRMKQELRFHVGRDGRRPSRAVQGASGEGKRFTLIALARRRACQRSYDS